MSLKIAMTGFVSADTGSIAGANAILLQKLLRKGLEIDFFSKPTFVDPRPLVGPQDAFRFVPVVNSLANSLRIAVSRVPVLASLFGRFDTLTYNRLLVARIRQEHSQRNYDAVVWLGDYAAGRAGIPTLSFAQGPPGTDARSIFSRSSEIAKLGGSLQLLKLKILARLRLSRLGLPPFSYSDHIIVGSQQSKQTLMNDFGLRSHRISSLPYAIDLELFQPAGEATDDCNAPLRVLWLGRIIPRKRLDLFLDGCRLAIENGQKIEITIIGSIGLVKGYERLIKAFPYPQSLLWISATPRAEIPAVMRCHDVLIQPSEEEDFGSSVAEALACGIPCIVGQTNGTKDYVCPHSIVLRGSDPKEMEAAIHAMASRKSAGLLQDKQFSRSWAEKTFNADAVAQAFSHILSDVVQNHPEQIVR